MVDGKAGGFELEKIGVINTTSVIIVEKEIEKRGLFEL